MPTALTSSNPPEVFVSYSHKDEKLFEKLEVYLKVLQDQKIITLLHSHRTVPGIDFEKEIEKNLSIAPIVLLLVSVDFLASHYCRVEYERAMERHKLKAVRVIPVILRPCNWRDTPFGKLQALPKDGEPVVKWTNIDDAFVSVIDGIKEAVKTLRPSIPSVTTTIEITLNESLDQCDPQRFAEALREEVRIDLKRITISIRSGSVKITIVGDHEELTRIVNALRDPERRERIFRAAKLKSITYIQDQTVHSLPIEPLTPKYDDTSNGHPINILRQAIRAVPAVKYALGVAGMAAAVAIVAGFSVDYKVAVLGTILMLGLMFGLVSFSFFAFNSTDAIRPLALTLAWTFVILTSSTSLCIFTGFFFDWPRPLEAYVRPGPAPLQSPLPTPSPVASSTPSPTPTVQPTPSSTPLPIRILITEVPSFNPVGDRNSNTSIAGRVLGVRTQDYRIVIYSLTLEGTWYVQPTTAEPKTLIGPDGSWNADIHGGMRYAILLVPPDFQPPDTTSQSPTRMSGVVASEEIDGKR